MARARVSNALQALGQSFGESRVGLLGGRQIQPARSRAGNLRIVRALKDHPELSAFDRETVRMLDTTSSSRTVSVDRLRSLHKSLQKLHATGKLPTGLGVTLQGRKGWGSFQKALVPKEEPKNKAIDFQKERERRLAIRAQMMREAAQREQQRQQAGRAAKPGPAAAPQGSGGPPLPLGGSGSLRTGGGRVGTDRSSVGGAAGAVGTAVASDRTTDAAADSKSTDTDRTPSDEGVSPPPSQPDGDADEQAQDIDDLAID